MTLCQRYKSELGGVAASEGFKAGAVQRMRQACDDKNVRDFTPAAGRRRFARVAALAACCTLVAALGLWYLAGRGGYGGAPDMEAPAEASAQAPETPALADAAAEADGAGAPQADAGALAALPVEDFFTGGMGFEGYLLYSFDEYGLDTATDAGAEAGGTLPVYKNRLRRQQDFSLAGGAGLTLEEMEQAADSAAAKLGLTMTQAEAYYSSTRDADGNPVRFLSALWGTHSGGGDLNVEDSGRVYITAAGADVLGMPESPPAADAPYGEHLAYLEDLIDLYRGTLLDDLADPQPRLRMDRGFDGTASWNYAVYDDGGGAGEALLSRSLTAASFYTADTGDYYAVSLQPGAGAQAEPAGVYPIITPGEALEQLEGGLWLTSAPEDFPGAGAVAGVELVYCTGPALEYLQPYYKFYVRLAGEGAALPAEAPEGLEIYGAWYIPAVWPEYLVWPGGQKPGREG